MTFPSWQWPFLLKELLGIENPYVSSLLIPMILGFGVSLGFCLLLVWTRNWHEGMTADYTSGIQKLHTNSIPRVGGAAIFSGLVVASLFSFELVEPILFLLLVAGGPAFIFGLGEDLTGKVSVRMRALATLVSGSLFIWLLSHSIKFELIPSLHWLVHYEVISILFTILAMSGLAQSINIIDGLNGLSGLVSVFAFSGFGLIAYQVGDFALMSCCFTLAAAALGFFCVNWPLGKIFLGDGGAYFIGFALAAMAVMLVERNLPVSDFAALLICVHPVTEVVFSMYRRYQRGHGITHPDRLHFHTLLKMRYVRKWFPRTKRVYRNSIAGLLMSSFTLLGVVLAVLNHENVTLSALLSVAMVALYITLYVRMARFRLTSPIKLKATLQQYKLRRHPKARQHARDRLQRRKKHRA